MKKLITLLFISSAAYAGTMTIAGGGTGKVTIAGGATGGAGTVTDNSYTRYWTGNSAANAGSGSNFFGAGWTTDSTSNGGPGDNIPFSGISIATATGNSYAYIGVPVPTGWTGAVNLKSFYALQFNQSGMGTGTHDYNISCSTPGTGDFSQPIVWNSSATVSFNVTSAGVGAIDTPTFSGSKIPTCSAGNTLLFRIIRENAGTATDKTFLVYFDISLPHTVQ